MADIVGYRQRRSEELAQLMGDMPEDRSCTCGFCRRQAEESTGEASSSSSATGPTRMEGVACGDLQLPERCQSKYHRAMLTLGRLEDARISRQQRQRPMSRGRNSSGSPSHNESLVHLVVTTTFDRKVRWCWLHFRDEARTEMVREVEDLDEAIVELDVGSPRRGRKRRRRESSRHESY